MNLNQDQRQFLEKLLRTSSVELISDGMCSALLHLPALAPKELLTAGIIFCGAAVDHEAGGTDLSSLRKLDLQGVEDTFTRCLSALASFQPKLETDGRNVPAAGLPTFDPLTQSSGPPTT